MIQALEARSTQETLFAAAGLIKYVLEVGFVGRVGTRCRAVSWKSDDSGCLLSRAGGTWRCLVRRDIHAPHLRADAMARTPELALASACARHLTPTPPLLRR